MSLPGNPDAEVAVLGAILQDGGALQQASGLLRPEDFSRSANQRTFAAALALFSRSKPVDIVTLTDELRQRKELESVGGPGELAALIENVPTTANVSYYCRIVREAGLKRRFAAEAEALAKECVNGIGLADLRARAEQALDHLKEPGEDALAPMALGPDAPAEAESRWGSVGKAGDLLTIAAEQEAGKSLSLEHALIAGAAGSSILGLQPPARPLRGMLFDEENSEIPLRLRFHSIAAGLGLSPGDLAALPLEVFCGQGIRLDRPEGRARLFAAVDRFRPDVVGLDSLIRFHGSDENDAGAASRLFSEALDPLRRQGILVVTLCHLRKRHRDAPAELAQRLRGSSDWAAMADQLIGARRLPDGRIILSHLKCRHEERLRDWVIRFTRQREGATVLESLGPPDEAFDKVEASKVAVLAALRDAKGEPIARQDLLRLGRGKWGERTGDEALKALVEEGRLATEKPGRVLFFRLADQEDEVPF